MTIEEQVKGLTDAVEKLVKNPVAPIAPIAPIAPVAPVNAGNDIITTLVNSVHNLDQKFTEKFADLKLSINDLKQNASNEVNATRAELVAHITEDNKMHNDHTVDIQKIQIAISVINTKMIVWGAVGGVLLIVIQFIANKFL